MNMMKLIALSLLLTLTSPEIRAQDLHETPEGFKALFSGRDLEGWDGGEIKRPSRFNEMSYQEWYDYRRRMIDGVNQHWRVEDGVLIGKGGGPDLVTWKQYGDFEMWIDWKVSEQTDAGLALRFGSQIKLHAVPDSKQLPQREAVGSGGLMTNQTHPSKPARKADRPVGQWNKMYVRMVGPYVTVVLNDVKVVDNVIFENIFDRTRPIDMNGPIHLQVKSGQVHYRHLYIKELTSEESNQWLSKIAGDEDQFDTVFNGKDLAGWAGAVKGYEVVGGALRCKRRDGGNLHTEKQYSNFIARLEFKLSPGGNNGILIRTPNTNVNHTRDTLELQILDDNHVMHRQLAPSQYHGSAYGIQAAIRGYLRPVGEWNHQEVYVVDDHIRVVLNGYMILDTRLKESAPDHPAATTRRGHLGLSGYADPIAFKKIRIREIE